MVALVTGEAAFVARAEATFDPYHKWLGIPPSEQPPHHYRLLGINPFEDDPEVIQAGADRQMGHVRNYQIKFPDDSERVLNELAAALVCLLDPRKRADYDARLRKRLGETGDEPPEMVPVEIVPSPNPSLWSLTRGAVRYYWLHGMRWWLRQTQVESALWRLGVEVHESGRYRERLEKYYARLEAIPKEPPKPIEEPTTGARESLLSSHRWRRLGRRMLRACHAAFLARRRAASFRELGRAAYQIDGLAAGPIELTGLIREQMARLADLHAELAELAEVPPGLLLSPRRLAWLFLAFLALVAFLYYSLRAFL
jgi:hypothetical protein